MSETPPANELIRCRYCGRMTSVHANFCYYCARELVARPERPASDEEPFHVSRRLVVAVLVVILLIVAIALLLWFPRLVNPV